MTGTPPRQSHVRTDRLLPVASWALYDFANTIFYAVVVTRYFSEHIVSLTGRHTAFFWGVLPAMVGAAFIAPWLGTYAGRLGVSKRLVLVLTGACALSTALLAAMQNAWLLLVFFAAAQLCFQLALVPYNNLLPAVASPRMMGRISGLGVGLGYIGVIVSLWSVDRLTGLTEEGSGYSVAYLTAAVLFPLFTIPFAFSVPEKAPEAAPHAVRAPRRLASRMSGLLAEVGGLLRDRDRRYFIIGNFFCADALNTVLFMLVVFLRKGKGFDDGQILNIMIWLNVAAFAGGVLWGFLTDFLTARWSMILAAAFLGAAIGTAQFAADPGMAFWSIVLLGGPGAAGLWVAGRKRVVQLSPKSGTGSLFGIYGMTNKLSLVTFFLFVWLADATDGYAWSVLVVMAALAFGIFCLVRSSPQSR